MLKPDCALFPLVTATQVESRGQLIPVSEPEIAGIGKLLTDQKPPNVVKWNANAATLAELSPPPAA
jgi:hypothetical protein